MAPPRDDDDGLYHPVDAIRAGVNGTVILGAAGLFFASVRNALRVDNVGAMAVFTKHGGTVFSFGMRSRSPSLPLFFLGTRSFNSLLICPPSFI